VRTSPDHFGQVKDALSAKKCDAVHAEVSMIAATQVIIEDPELAAQINKLVEALEEVDDVQEVYTNADIRC
jgi:transcriptional/translational regulatory protein YebC/TACO1